MELLLLKAYGNGYRGCVIEKDRYLFFQCSRKKGLRHLKSYLQQEFTDTEQFMAMMQKFVSPPSFLHPPVSIETLSMEELDRVHSEIIKARKAGKHSAG
jgi:hypothetical protein